MNKAKITAFTLAVGVGMILGAGGLFLFSSTSNHSTSIHSTSNHSEPAGQQASTDNQEPIYWVAPMDPNFKRDKPGKSPMGMDLVPVFANDLSSDSPGTVKIDPVTINNLGVKTTSVQMVTPNLTIRALGRVAFAEDAIVHIHPRVEGWIESLAVRSKGEYVEQGEALYSLYSPDLVNAQEELLIALAQGNRALIEGAKSRLMALNAPANLIKRIEDNRKIERTITFTAPKSGYVNELNIQSGFYVSPSTTMLSIANMDKVWVLGDVFASDVSKIALGQAAIVKSDYFPTKQIAAEISYIYPTLNPITRTATVRLVLDNPDSMLKPDMFTSVSINAFQADSEMSNKVLAIPEQALIRSGESDRVVLVLGEGKFKSINVTLGRIFDDVIEVVSGLEEGDVIVSSAQFLLDSESSISSDFMRMEAPETAITNTDEIDMEVSAWTSASVNEVMLGERMVNITHGPLDAFNMMGMSMNFMVAEDIDISQFEEGMEVHVEIVKTPSGMYMIKTAHFGDMGMEHDAKSDTESESETDNDPHSHEHHGGHAQ